MKDQGIETRNLGPESSQKIRAVLEQVRDRFFPADQPEQDRDYMWDGVNEALSSPPEPIGGEVISLDKHEAALGEIIDQRDQFEEAFGQAYYLIMGRAADWSSQFGVAEALEDIDDAQTVLRKSVALNSTGVEAPHPPSTPEGEAVRVAIAALVEQVMSAGALCYDSVDNPARWQSVVKTYTDALTALRRSGEGV